MVSIGTMYIVDIVQRLNYKVKLGEINIPHEPFTSLYTGYHSKYSSVICVVIIMFFK